MIELIHTYWRESKTRFWEYLAWPEEKLSDLNSILAVYREVDEVNERWVKDLLVVDENCTMMIFLLKSVIMCRRYWNLLEKSI
jgi:hypothetical protein